MGKPGFPDGSERMRATSLREDEERDRRVLAERRADDERVEELVVAEDARHGIGPLARVDDGADGVEEAAAASSVVPVTPVSLKISGNATTPTQPSASPIAAATHVGASTQTNFWTIAASAPAHTIASTAQRQLPSSTSRPYGV